MDINRSGVHEMDRLISELVSYGLQHDLVHADDKTYVVNRLLELFGKNEFQWVDVKERRLEEIVSIQDSLRKEINLQITQMRDCYED